MIRYLVVPWERLIAEVHHAGVVIDIGSGDGLFLVLLRDAFPGLTAIGIEHDERKRRAGKTGHPPGVMMVYDWKELDVTPLPLADYVTMTDVLYSIPLPAWDALFRFACDRLKPGGRLIIKETIGGARWKQRLTLLQEAVAIKVLGYTKGSTPHMPAVGTYLEVLRRHGLECVCHEPIDRWYPWPHYLVVARKPTPSERAPD